MSRFPEGFVFGASTSSYQIEGGTELDGRGESIWDRFRATPGKVEGGADRTSAADHYRRFAEDVRLLQGAHVDAYRFSVAWPRIQPSGRGKASSIGLDFYDRLVDHLLAADIEPWVCLFHWDLPQGLEDRGGWSSRDIIGRFDDYALAVGERLTDRVVRWLPFNEPSIFAVLGHLVGVHAPGSKSFDRAVAVSHHQNVATASSAEALRSLREDLAIGNALSLNWIEPASDSSVDIDAAHRRRGFMNDAHLEPFTSGEYPEAVGECFRPWLAEGDLERCRGAVDFVGVNYYTRLRVFARQSAKLVESGVLSVDPRAETTDMGWEVAPHGLHLELRRLSEAYPDLPLYITENGAAFGSDLSPSRGLEDDARIRFLERHLEACLEAIADGVDLRGYFVWSLLDNFEWAEGYSRRFGLVHVDYETQERRPRASYDWYARLAQARDLSAARQTES